MFVCRGFGPSHTSCRDMRQCLLVFVRVSQQSYNIKINKHNSVKNLRKQHGSYFNLLFGSFFYISIINLDCSSDKVTSLEGLCFFRRGTVCSTIGVVGIVFFDNHREVSLRSKFVLVAPCITMLSDGVWVAAHVEDD